MFDTVLIANRGEIACRIIKTCRKMGLKTIAVFSDADKSALHVKLADEAVHIGPAPASESYLRADRIIEAAKRSGAGAIHPGYGFLSEREDLIRACEEEDIEFIGPNLAAIASMGAKIEAKEIAQKADMPIIPGFVATGLTTEEITEKSAAIGLPIMVKASAGGGGKGMRAVHDAETLPAAIAEAETEAIRAFGDGRLMVEKLIENPRHIEVQLLGDKHGGLVHLFERDCSVQRNHQKLLEEAPAPNLKKETREALYQAALNLGAIMGYYSAGTVEFIMDAKSEAFYFLEMNTRLQVEHTVSEEITGLDLVEQQIRVARGEKLAFAQEDITCKGHAIEARINAEDPAQSFLPQTGKLVHWQGCEGLRLDSGVARGSEISAHYDSMLAKLIAAGPDREAARNKLIRGLEGLELAGLKSNRSFLREALRQKAFAKGEATTDFIPFHWPQGWQEPDSWQEDQICLAAIGDYCLSQRQSQEREKSTPWTGLSGFHLLSSAGRGAQIHYAITRQGENEETVLCLKPQQGPREGEGENFVISLEGASPEEDRQFEVSWLDERHMVIGEAGRSRTYCCVKEGEHIHLSCPLWEAAIAITPLGEKRQAASGGATGRPDQLVSQMHGLIAEIHVKEGDEVSQGQSLVTMESMKLLMDLKAEASGRVKAVTCALNQTVEAGDVLVTLTLADEA
ncbi:MAG: biotin/lipoyl-binding protein [Cohaesibacter sp.]|jgi:3-methylcrotonyl-CoA carboxylase alpha subunit|nr:biotin/lipoyl-binding protein [Cohaesibacter sp.]